MLQRLVPDPFSILLNSPKQPLHARNFFKNKIICKEDYQKALKKLTLFFLSNPVPFNGQNIKNKRGLELVTSCSSGYKASSEKSKFDQVWWYNIEWFLSYYKNYICKFMQANSFMTLPLFHFHLPFWIWKVRKGRGKITKSWISREWKGLFRWNKKHFS